MTPADQMLDRDAGEELLQEFDYTWAEHQFAPLSSFLKRLANTVSDDSRHARELCLIDLEYRWKLSNAGQQFDDHLGGHPKVQDYAHRWPDLVEALTHDGSLGEEYRVRRLWGDDPTPDRFLSEQPQPRLSLLGTLRTVDAELVADEVVGDHFAGRSSGPRNADPRAPMPFTDFTLHELIGRGGMSKVYRATQLSLDRTVAIKALLKSLQRDPNAVDRFVEEGKLIARLRHPNIVGVHGLGCFPGGGYFLALDYVAGSNLASKIDAAALPLHEAIQVVACVARAVDYAHSQGVIHCDLKPSNVLVGDDQTVLLTDFGLALLTIDGAQAARGRAGTLGFMAPELALNEQAVITPAIDVYGLGALLFALLTQRPPVAGRTWEEFVSSIERLDVAAEVSQVVPANAPLGALLGATLARSPGDRPASAAAVADGLEQHL